MVNREGVGLLEVICYCVVLAFLSVLVSLFLVCEAGANTYGVDSTFAELLKKPVGGPTGSFGQDFIATWGEIVDSSATGVSRGWVSEILADGIVAGVAETVIPIVVSGESSASILQSAKALYDIWVTGGCTGHIQGCTQGAGEYPNAKIPDVGVPSGYPVGKWIDSSLWAADGVGPAGANVKGCGGASVNINSMGGGYQNCVDQAAAVGCTGGPSGAIGCGAYATSCGYAASGNASCWNSNWWDNCNGATGGAVGFLCIYPGGANAGQIGADMAASNTIGVMKTPVNDAQLTQMLTNALANKDAGAMAFAVAAINGMNNAQLAGMMNDANSLAAWSALSNALVAGLSSTQKTNLDNLINTPGVAPQPNPYQPPLGGLTDAGVEADVSKGMSDWVGGQAPPGITVPPGNATIPPSPPSVTPPDKDSITTVLNTWYSSILALPIMSWLSSQTPDWGGGDPIITLPTPELFSLGGGIVIDFSQFESLLQFMGNCLLAIVGVKWTMWFFSGRGDA